ncbi:MAG: carbon monoxide dehydrogenase subunit G, partial [Gammaproteobacteria bacterium]|nr:carbon monoxide dehydrogenase subunit G [Gammaproteobacteria bacterium]
MVIEGSHKIPISRDIVWDALSDPDTLRSCIPGCASFVEKAENEYAATIRASVGPVSSAFSINIVLSEMKPPKSYKITGRGKGAGTAGFAQGSATLVLVEHGTETELHYTADTKVGGKLAQVGSRLIEVAAYKLADGFFTNLVRHLEPGKAVEKDDNKTSSGYYI